MQHDYVLLFDQLRMNLHFHLLELDICLFRHFQSTLFPKGNYLNKRIISMYPINQIYYFLIVILPNFNLYFNLKMWRQLKLSCNYCSFTKCFRPSKDWSWWTSKEIISLNFWSWSLYCPSIQLTYISIFKCWIKLYKFLWCC